MRTKTQVGNRSTLRPPGLKIGACSGLTLSGDLSQPKLRGLGAVERVNL